jgi:hypothetical protein
LASLTATGAISSIVIEGILLTILISGIGCQKKKRNQGQSMRITRRSRKCRGTVNYHAGSVMEVGESVQFGEQVIHHFANFQVRRTVGGRFVLDRIGQAA